MDVRDHCRLRCVARSNDALSLSERSYGKGVHVPLKAHVQSQAPRIRYSRKQYGMIPVAGLEDDGHGDLPAMPTREPRGSTTGGKKRSRGTSWSGFRFKKATSEKVVNTTKTDSCFKDCSIVI